MNNSQNFAASRRNGPTLGAIAIARDEVVDIRGFVEHLKGWIDEIVIVDDGSTDGTLEYLANCGFPVKVVHRRLEPEGGFAQQRNHGIDNASSDWLVHMDIDERVSPQLAAEMRAAIGNTDRNAFRYRRLNYFLHRPFPAGGWQNWNEPQLGRRGVHRFERPIHEKVVVEGGDEATGQLKSVMHHLADANFGERLRKNVSYSERTAREIVGRGRRVRVWHLLSIPLRRALSAYLFRGAWRHGTLGLIFSLYTFAGTFNWYACAWDQQNRISRELLEEEIAKAWGKEDEYSG